MPSRIVLPSPVAAIRKGLLVACLLLLYACKDPSAETAGTKADAIAPHDVDTASYQPPLHKVSNHYRAGDTLYCYARSGLVLRDRPAQNGAKRALVPIYAQVEVIDPAPFAIAFQTKEASGLDVPGHWVQVWYQGQEGWLFDGYLLAYPPSGPLRQIPYWSQFAKLIARDTVPPAPEPGMYGYQHLTWANGVEFTEKHFDGGVDHITILPRAEFNLAQAWLYAVAEGPEESPFVSWDCTLDAKTGGLECTHVEGYGRIGIQKTRQGDIEIEENWAD